MEHRAWGMEHGAWRRETGGWERKVFRVITVIV